LKFKRNEAKAQKKQSLRLLIVIKFRVLEFELAQGEKSGRTVSWGRSHRMRLKKGGTEKD